MQYYTQLYAIKRTSCNKYWKPSPPMTFLPSRTQIQYMKSVDFGLIPSPTSVGSLWEGGLRVIN